MMECAVLTARTFFSWFLFACLWYLTFLQHGDFAEENRLANSSHIPCVQTINDFTSCFLFSIETQHTIGYGTRQEGHQSEFSPISSGGGGFLLPPFVQWQKYDAAMGRRGEKRHRIG